MVMSIYLKSNCNKIQRRIIELHKCYKKWIKLSKLISKTLYVCDIKEDPNKAIMTLYKTFYFSSYDGKYYDNPFALK